MLGKAKKRASRVGCRPVKIHFAVEIESASFPARCLVPDKAILSVCFERKAKSTATGNFVCKILPENKESVVVVVKESLEMVTILFKDSRTKRHQKKAGKLVLRELSKQGLFGQYNYKALGTCDLNLHQIADELGTELSVRRCGIVVYDNLKGVVLKFSVVATVLSADNGCHFTESSFDTASEVSDASDLSELTSNSLLGSGDKDGSGSDVYMVFESAPPRTHVGSYLDSSALNVSQEGIEEEGSDSGRSHSAVSGSHLSPAPPQPSPRSERSSPRMSTSTSTSALTRLLSKASDIPAIKHVLALYDQEMRLRGEHVAQLEQRLAEVTAENSVLRAVSSPTEDASSSHSQEELHLQAELNVSRSNEERLRRALEAEMLVVRDAAAAAANSAVLRAETEDECQTLLTELIALKMEKANTSMAMDALKRKNRDLAAELVCAQRGTST